MSALTTFIVDKLRNKKETAALNAGGPMRVRTPAEIAERRLNSVFGAGKSETPTDRKLREMGL